MKFCIFLSALNFLIVTKVNSLTSSENAALIRSRFNCNFGRGSCGWVNDRISDDFNWRRGSGRAAKQRGSGPSRDHAGGGYYMYIQSRSRGNRTARLLSPIFFTHSNSCFTFWYYMKGRTLGHLEVLISYTFGPVSKEIALWNLRGHQANRWLKAVIPLRGRFYRRQLIIEAFDWERGRSGNIAIDDVKMSEWSSSCSVIQPSYANPRTSNNEPSTQPLLTFTPISTTSLPVSTMVTKTSSSNRSTTSIPNSNGTIIYFRTPIYNLTTSASTTSSEAFTSKATTAVMMPSRQFETVMMSSKRFETSSKSSTVGNEVKEVYLSTTAVTTNFSNRNQLKLEGRTLLAQKSEPGKAIGLTLGLLAAAVLLVAIAIYIRKKMRGSSKYNDKCTVVMTRMHPDVIVNTNISFQKLE